MFKTLTLAGGLAAAAVALAAPASADDAGYLARLERNHVSYGSQPDAIQWGNSVCGQLSSDAPVPSVVSSLQNGGGFTSREAGTIVGAASSELCPDQYPKVMDWAHGQLS